jgi:glutaredoxin-related protein
MTPRCARATHRPTAALQRLAILAVWLLAGLVAAQGAILSPQAIVVNPSPAFGLQVWLDKDPTGAGTPSYAVGEGILISVRPAVDSYVYLFSLSAAGEVTQVLPNRYDASGGNHFVRANTVRTFPPIGARYTFNVAPPNGLAKVFAVASLRPLDTSTLASFRGEGDFATSNLGESGFARALSIVVSPVPNAEWVSATALYFVGTPPTLPVYGSIAIDTTPTRAEIFVDGNFVGFSPLTYQALPGVYGIEARGAARSASQRVSVVAGRTTDVQLTLQPILREGSASFTSTPTGAQVYLEGRLIGTTPINLYTLIEGTYHVEVQAPGYQTDRRTITVAANAVTRSNVTLVPLLGAIDLTANVGGARVFLNGRDVGVIPSGSGRLLLRDLSDGLYEITLVAPGYRTVLRDVRVTPGQTIAVNLRAIRF